MPPSLKDSSLFLKPSFYNSQKANKRKRTAEMVKNAMYRAAAVEMFHRGAVLVRKERLLLIALMTMLMRSWILAMVGALIVKRII